MAAIRVAGLTKEYGTVRALANLDLEVREGEIYGFLGPNGAGKSTTINVLLDFVRPTSGRAEVLGYDAQQQSKAVRQRVGILPEGYGVYERLTAEQHIEFVAESKGVEADPHRLLERVGLDDAIERRAGGFSKGMAQRLALAMALVGDPELLILDEPTTGLDPNGAREIRGIVREENERGTTVFFSSHVLGQVEAVCDRVGILQAGQLVAEDTVEDLRDSIGAEGSVIATVEGPTDGVAGAVERVEGVSSASASGDQVRISCSDRAKLRALNAVESAGPEVVDVDVVDASLEDVFTEITTERDRSGAAGAGPNDPAQARPPGGGPR